MSDLKDTIASEVLSASLGGAFSTTALYPLEVLKTRMQADAGEDDEGEDKKSKKEVGMMEYAKRLYEKEGLQVYMNGVQASACQASLEKGLYFFAYTALKNLRSTLIQVIFPASAGKPMSATTNLLLGCLAEWCHLPITMPIDCLTTAIQTSQKQNAFTLLMTILKEGNMYKGIQAYYVLCFKPALQYTVFEQVKAVMLKSRKEKTLTASEAFLLGMFARSIATIAVYPFVRAKVIMQTRKKAQASDSNVKDPTILTLLGDVYKTDGLGGLFQGLGPEITRGALSAALMMMVKEQISGGVKTALYATSGSKSNHTS